MLIIIIIFAREEREESLLVDLMILWYGRIGGTNDLY